ncbi:hypothetical protein KY289_018315 [Solanum tuberosum]|nr:hypothetical protein KY289_018315 [Solanum tuberosum]
MYMLIKCRRLGMRCSGNLPKMITEVEDYNPRVKYNTDGASRGNPRIMSFYAFCLRNEMGDILHAEGATIDITTNAVAEAYKAILEEACKHCKQSQHNQHILREGNQLVDYFANIALDKRSCRYSQFKSIETRGRKEDFKQ